jgi:proteic killer suppression protein
MLEVYFKSRNIERICTDYTFSKRKYGERMAYLIHQRIGELKAAESVDMLVQFSIGRCHPLKGNRRNVYAMDLVHPYRLVFELYDKNNPKAIRVLRIVDYH